MALTAAAIAVRKLEDDMRNVINAAYKTGRDRYACIRDFVADMSWNDAWENLVREETAREREHESSRPNSVARSRMSNMDAAKLLLLHNVADGARNYTDIQAEKVFTLRPTAFKAIVLGYVLRDALPEDWLDRALALDYVRAKRPE